MKYRTNVSLPDGVKPENIPKRKGYKTLTYKLKVITPIYGGGVEAGKPDKDMPIRATAIRGQLRYWWRFLQMNHPDTPLQGEELFKEERRIWGGMTDDPRKDGSSKVFISCNLITDKKNIEKYKYANQAPQYALFPARENKREKTPAKELIKEGTEFELKIQWRNEVIDFNTQIEPCLRWWIAFGGVGARTRRGVGSVLVTDNSLLAPNEDECKKFKCRLVFQRQEFTDPKKAWINAVNKLYEFRQAPSVGRNQGHGNMPGRSFWPEPDSIREILSTCSTQATIMRSRWNRQQRAREEYEYDCNDHTPSHLARISFPRAAFGLPIVFKFKDEDCGEPKQTILLPDLDQAERMASPLILTPYRKEGKYFSAALLLPSIAHSISLKLKKGEREVVRPHRLSNEWNENNWNEWPKNWWSNDKTEHVPPISSNNAVNALNAFMNFFEKGGK